MSDRSIEHRQVEQAIRTIAIPQVDLHEQIMHKLPSASRQIASIRKPSRSRLTLYAVIVATLIIGSGYVGMEWLTLQQQTGQTWTIRPFNADNPPPASTASLREQETMRSLQPGDAWLIRDPDNPDNGNLLLIKPYGYESWLTLRQALGNPDDLPHALPEGFDLQQVSLTVQPAAPLNMVSGEESYVIQATASVNDWSAISISLRQQEMLFTASITRGLFSSDTLYTHLDGEHRLLNIDGNDAAIIRDAQGVRLYWKNHGDQPWTYSIAAPLAASDEQLLTLLAGLRGEEY